MDVFKLEATPREAGRHTARLLRRAESVPCIVYGGKMTPLPIQVPHRSLQKLVFSHEQQRVELKVENDRFDCILKDYSVNPQSFITHADFLVLQSNQRVSLTVPIRYVGTPVGQLEQGGETTIAAHELHVSCLPNDIPAHIDVDISALHIGESMHVSDLKVSSVELLDAPARTLVAVLAPRVEVEAEAEAPAAAPSEQEED